MNKDIVNENIFEIKPNFTEASARWEAFWNHDVIDRPVLVAAVGKPDTEYKPSSTYFDRVYGNLDEILGNNLHNAGNTIWLGESMPSFWSSLGTHEIAAFCGYDVVWAKNGADTNWCKHSDKPLREILPLKINEDGYMWKRAIELYKRADKLFAGRVIPFSFDFHSNLDLLLSVRGDANLCFDIYDCPDDIDRGVENACGIFKFMWETFKEVSGCEKYGYFFDLYSSKPTTSLACDFSALIGGEHFKRWALPALTYESELVGERAIYHWDGPDAIKHCVDIFSIKNIHTIRYVPSPGTYHYQFLELYRKCQDNGKSICYTGSPDEIKAAHKVLDPNKTVYCTSVNSEKEFEELERWFINNM